MVDIIGNKSIVVLTKCLCQDFQESVLFCLLYLRRRSLHEIKVTVAVIIIVTNSADVITIPRVIAIELSPTEKKG